MIIFPSFKVKSIFVTALTLATSAVMAQTKQPAGDRLKRPKLVVGIMIDQMRWDYLYRYYDRYSEGGFKRLLKDGFRCENTYINYLPSATAVGHAAAFSGTVPAINGIAGNDWVDQTTGKSTYCTSDSTVSSVGVTSPEGKMSPRNLLSTTVTDELRLASNFKSKVIGISLKDRAAILPAGHMPTGAYWFEDVSGRFITSNYYMNELPAWVNNFNNQNEPAKLVASGWNTLYPINTYAQSTADNVAWEGKFSGETTTAFPHAIDKFYPAKHSVLRSTPFGNTLTLDFAKAAIEANKLGSNGTTDFLTINCASTDYVGHMFGPNSIEEEDTFLRLDRDLAAFFKNLDDKLGKGNYLVFISADHGASHAINFNKENKIPAGQWNSGKYTTQLNQLLKEKFGQEGLVIAITEFQVNFNLAKIKAKKLDYEAIKQAAMAFFKEDPQSLFVVDMEHISAAAVPTVLKEKIINAYNYKRSGSIMVVPSAGWIDGGATGTTHGEWNAYDTHIPLIFMGWGVKPGASYGNVYTTDIAPTIAALLKIQAPSGSIGSPITAILSGSETTGVPAKPKGK